MGERTAIEWTDQTWNPWHGCTKVSPGCAHCYMFRDKRRYGQDPNVVVRSARATFTAPLRWKNPARVFTCSWSDFFHLEADVWRDEAWDIIRETPHLTYQILTKRVERIADCLPNDWGEGWPNVWLGTSVENSRWTARIALLLGVPARLHFLSCEPLLGPLTIAAYMAHPLWAGIPGWNDAPTVKWVIVGGESGPNARPMELDWARDLRDECARAGVPFFLKQLGGIGNPRAHHQAVLDGFRHVETPSLAPEERGTS